MGERNHLGYLKINFYEKLRSATDVNSEFFVRDEILCS